MTSEDLNKSVFSGFLWEIKRNYRTEEIYTLKSVFWFDSGSNMVVNNDSSNIMIAEPIIGVDDAKRKYVIENLKTKPFYLKYEDGKWKLVE